MPKSALGGWDGEGCGCKTGDFMSHKSRARAIFLGSLTAFLIMGAGFAAPVGAQESEPSLREGLPSGLAAAVQGGAPEADDGDSALPEGDVSPRAPGMQLPVSAGAGGGSSAAANPFAPPPVEVIKTPEQIEAEIREQSFNAALTGLLPLKPAEIRKLLEKYDETRQAIETPIYPYPKAEIVTQDVVLDPGATPPVIKLSPGHVTVVNFIDITGQPWPIQDVSWAGNFELIKSEAGGARLGISPLSDYAYGNMAVQLLEMKTPVSLTLETQREKVHYRFDARVGEYGPYAIAPLVETSAMTSLAAGSSTLAAVLEGVAPSGSERLTVNGVDGRTTAYSLAGVTYVRTPLTLLSPAWSSSISSADGMNVYTLKNAPVLLLSDKGQVVRARLNEKEATYDQ